MRTIGGRLEFVIPLLTLVLMTGCASIYSWAGLLSPQRRSAAEAQTPAAKTVGVNPAGSPLQPPSGSLTQSPLQLPDVIKVALRDNPELLAAKAQWFAGQERPAQARSLEDPVLGYGYFGRSVETRVGPQEQRIGLAQKFPFFGKRRLRGEVAAQEAERLGADYEAMQVEILARVKAIYYGLYMAHKAIEITEENLDILRRFAGTAISKYAAGKVSQQDVLKAQVELSQLANELLTLRQQKETAAAALNLVLNRPAEAPLGTPGEFVITPLTRTAEELQRKALARSPVLRALEEDIQKSRA
ncbi:MAG: TolC family protein, partial [Anaerolineae bacterium]